jgi:N-acetylneuraminic acid mutarotase
MPTPRSEVAVAAVAGKIYVVGGFEADGSPSDKVEVYDPVTDAWGEIAPLPEPRHHTAATAVADIFLYVIGGFGTTFSDPQSTVYRYDTTRQTWEERASLPTARGGHAVTPGPCPRVAAPCLYAIGGSDEGQENVAQVEAYNDMTNAWTAAADIPTARDHLASLNDAAGEKVYAIGGRRNVDFGQNLDASEEYDRATDTWTARSPLPTARSGIAAAFLAGRIFVFGGEGSSGTFDENEGYDPVTDTWETFEPMPTARHGLGAAVVGDTIYVIGGGETPGLSVSGANEAFTP